ncbi:Homeobox protein KNOX3 [Hordeum vulgare]|nr:Homeobox protein KNOX3 [Hordeum vulgare]
MTEHYPGDGAAANGFGRSHLREDEARLLYEADYPMPPDMRVPGSWRLSTVGVSVPPPPIGADWRAEIVCIRSGLPESSRNLLRYAPNSNALLTAYFEHYHVDQLIATNRVKPRGRHNSEGRRQWWGVPSRTLEAVLDHIEGTNTPRYDYPPPPTFSRRPGSTWTTRRMDTATSSSSGGSNSHSPDCWCCSPSSRSHRRRRWGSARAAPASSSMSPALPPASSARRRRWGSCSSSRSISP